MSRRLIAYVHVDGIPYGPDDKIPAAIARRIGEHAWADTDTDADQDDGHGGDFEAPPRSGRGSGVEAWRAFAEQHDVEVAADASREDIIAACEAAGVVEREE
ncbi:MULTISPECIES: hypothetical protein [unclassified Streptomyces]|uniref:hypothetical protein n=1 Tax=unclassified Streptomyces TaxID=2593676 RepID=UPI00343FBD89